MIKVYVDGCRKRDGRGAWAAIIMLDKPVLLGGFSPDTTNNIMELSGPVYALSHLKENGVSSAQVTSDSQYFVNGFNQWMHAWCRRGWKRKSKKSQRDEVKNLDIWKKLHVLYVTIKSVKAEWVRGHNGHKENELCDQFANFLCTVGNTRIFKKKFDSLDEIELYINSAADLEKDLKSLMS